MCICMCYFYILPLRGVEGREGPTCLPLLASPTGLPVEKCNVWGHVLAGYHLHIFHFWQIQQIHITKALRTNV